MTSRSWFVPAPGYSGLLIVLSCGRHTKDGRFIPKNVVRDGDGGGVIAKLRRMGLV
jgi:hypothetical protein